MKVNQSDKQQVQNKINFCFVNLLMNMYVMFSLISYLCHLWFDCTYFHIYVLIDCCRYHSDCPIVFWFCICTFLSLAVTIQLLN